MSDTQKIKASALVAYARNAVGGGYCFGASGQMCSLKQRQIWAKDNPSQAENLLGICAKWDGKPVWDCSGIPRGAWRELLKYRSGGATTIFNTWTSQTGAIDTMPDVPGIALFRANSNNPATKEHIGIYVGGGLVVDARSSASGVLIGTVQSYGRWTHWAYFDDVDYSEYGTGESGSVGGDTPLQTTPGPGPGQAMVTGGGALRLRKEPKADGDIIKGMPSGTIVPVLARSPGWARVEYVAPDGMRHMGWCNDLYLEFGG